MHALSGLIGVRVATAGGWRASGAQDIAFGDETVATAMVNQLANRRLD
jgi:hypothetical protein